jgi:carbonic anhydrase/acetyltransferase-like protein (isoleucine patch superfamily)
MGAPARVRRELSEEEIRFVLESAANYVRYRVDYVR